MMSDLNCTPLEVRPIRYRLIFFYKVIHHLVAIPYSNLLIPVNTRTRHTNPNSFGHQKTATNTHSSPGLSHFGINCLQHLPLQTQLHHICYRTCIVLPVTDIAGRSQVCGGPKWCYNIPISVGLKL
jgi:hypothetical protein